MQFQCSKFRPKFKKRIGCHGNDKNFVSSYHGSDDKKSNLMFIKDRRSNIKFLIDTGACISLIPSTLFESNKATPEDPYLQAANGTPIKTFGEKLLTLNIGLRRNYAFPFIIADVKHAIIGADFLTKHALTINMSDKTINDPTTKISVKTSQEKAELIPINTNTKGLHANLLKKYPSLTNTDLKVPSVMNQYAHKIKTTGEPPTFRPRKLNPKMTQIAKDAINEMLDEGILKPSTSPYSSPLHIVPKKQGWRLVGDYRALNRITEKDTYSLPYMQNFSMQLAGKTVFSKIDLKNAYFHIPIAEEDKHKTAIITQFGAYQFEKMNFGLCNAAQSFQRFLDNILRNLKSKKSGKDVTYFAYVDDIIVASNDNESHLDDLDAMFEVLSKYNLKINTLKCQFFKNEIEYLGHNVTSKGMMPLPEKVEAIANYPIPETYKQLRRFIGMINYYHRFVKHVAGILAPLNNLLMGYKKTNRNRKIQWTESATAAFEKAKKALADATYLNYPKIDAQLGLFCDASAKAVGAVLQQKNDNGNWEPLGFFSRKLNKRDQLGSAFAREVLAIYLSLRHFHHWVEGNKIEIFTDHKPIISAFEKPLDRPNAREARQLAYIAQYNPVIKHIPGKSNIVADSLSRPQIDSICGIAILTHSLRDRLIAAQKQDSELEKLISEENSLNLKLIDDIYCDVRDNNNLIRPYVPEKLRYEIFKLVHNLSHPGAKQTVNLVSERFVWPFLKKDIKKFVQECIQCQLSKVNRHNKTIIKSIPNDVPKLSTVHIDIVGPLPSNRGYSYLLTCIDRFTRWPEVIPMIDIRAETVANAFISGWISRYGIPETIVTDRGSQFESSLFNNLLRQIGCTHKRTTAYNPRCNGLIERFHRTMKNALRNGESHNWIDRLPLIMLSLRSSFKEELKASPSEIMYGCAIKLPIDLLIKTNDNSIKPDTYVENLKKVMQKLVPPVTRNPSNTSYIDPKLALSSHVFIRNENKKGLMPNYRGPYKVLKRFEKYFLIQLETKTDTIAIDRLKTAHLASNDNDNNFNQENNDEMSFSNTPNPPIPVRIRAAVHEQPRNLTRKVTFADVVKTKSGRTVNKPIRYRQ